MQEITLESLRDYFKKPPRIDLLEQQAGLQRGYLGKILRGEKPLTQRTIEKLKPFIK